MMIGSGESGGFQEVSHTADWALKVWAERLEELFVQAAAGMYYLLDISLKQDSLITKDFSLAESDLETMLVAFLSELLYYLEHDQAGFDQIQVKIEKGHLHADLRGGKVTGQTKEIKAVTYHNLKILQNDGRFETTIVFDV